MPERLLALARGPWWAKVILGGISAGAAIAAALGLVGTSAQGREPHIATAGISAVADDPWRTRMEQKIDQTLREMADTRERLARIEGRLERERR